MQSVGHVHLHLVLFVAWYLAWFAGGSFVRQTAKWGPYRRANVNSLLTEKDVRDFAAPGKNPLRANLAFRPQPDDAIMESGVCEHADGRPEAPCPAI